MINIVGMNFFYNTLPLRRLLALGGLPGPGGEYIRGKSIIPQERD
jgi:hypothetical protein